MRLTLILITALILTIALSLFPDVASQMLRIEAFGYQFEAPQGAFVVGIIILWVILWLIQRLFSAIVAGPGQLWQTLRMGSKKRREQRLRDGIAQWLNMRGDYGRKAMSKSRGILPDWGIDLLQILSQPAAELDLLANDADKLSIALTARVATDINAKPQADLVIRKAHLEHWLQSYPESPLATIRLADLAIEEQDWHAAIKYLDIVWKQGLRPASVIKPQLAHAWLMLSNAQPEHVKDYLNKAQRMSPDSPDVILAIGQAYITSKDAKAAEKLWLTYLQKNDDLTLAQACFDILKVDALAAFRRLEKKQGSPAFQWLHARLAYEGNLVGLADEALTKLLSKHPRREFWQTQAEWHMSKHEWEKATMAYQASLKV